MNQSNFKTQVDILKINSAENHYKFKKKLKTRKIFYFTASEGFQFYLVGLQKRRTGFLLPHRRHHPSLLYQDNLICQWESLLLNLVLYQFSIQN